MWYKFGAVKNITKYDVNKNEVLDDKKKKKAIFQLRVASPTADYFSCVACRIDFFLLFSVLMLMHCLVKNSKFIFRLFLRFHCQWPVCFLSSLWLFAWSAHCVFQHCYSVCGSDYWLCSWFNCIVVLLIFIFGLLHSLFNVEFHQLFIVYFPWIIIFTTSSSHVIIRINILCLVLHHHGTSLSCCTCLPMFGQLRSCE